MKRKSLALLCATAILLIGCQEEGNNLPSSPPAQESTEKSTDLLEAKLPEEVDLSQAWKHASPLVQEAILEDRRAFVPLALSESGDEIVASVPKQNGKPAQVLLYDIGTKQYEVIHSLPEDFQAIGADLNDRWVVWSEMDSAVFQDWKLHVYDRQLKVDRVVRKSEKKYPMPLLMPSLYQNDVVYGKGIAEPTSKGPSIVVAKYNLLSGEETQVTNLGGNPLITKNYVIWNGRDERNATGEVFWDKDGTNQQVTQGEKIFHFTSDGTAVAWSSNQKSESDSGFNGNKPWSITILENGKSRVIKENDPANALHFLSMSPRLVAWNSYDKAQVYDRNLDKIVTLEKQNASMVYVVTRGDFLLWTTPLAKNEEEMGKLREQYTNIMPATLHLLDLTKID